MSGLSPIPKKKKQLSPLAAGASFGSSLTSKKQKLLRRYIGNHLPPGIYAILKEQEDKDEDEKEDEEQEDRISKREITGEMLLGRYLKMAPHCKD